MRRAEHAAGVGGQPGSQEPMSARARVYVYRVVRERKSECHDHSSHQPKKRSRALPPPLHYRHGPRRAARAQCLAEQRRAGSGPLACILRREQLTAVDDGQRDLRLGLEEVDASSSPRRDVPVLPPPPRPTDRGVLMCTDMPEVSAWSEIAFNACHAASTMDWSGLMSREKNEGEKKH